MRSRCVCSTRRFTPCSRRLEYLRLLGKGSVGSFCATACWCVWPKKKSSKIPHFQPYIRQKCTREHSISPQDWVLDIQLNIKRCNFRIPDPGRQCNPSLSVFLERKIPREGVLLLRGLRPSLFYLTTNLCATVEYKQLKDALINVQQVAYAVCVFTSSLS